MLSYISHFFKSKTLPAIQTDNNINTSLEIINNSAGDLLNKEWLLTNNRGGYASSTVVGCNTRRYHGLLIGSPNPPANRIMALGNLLETIQTGSETFNLSTFEFDNGFYPEGFVCIKQFRKDIGVHFDYEFGKFQLTKSIYLLHNSDTVAITYDFKNIDEELKFSLRPLIGLRDFHQLQKSYVKLSATDFNNDLVIRCNEDESCKLFLNCPDANFQKDEQWWFNFVYRSDRQRGQDFKEDLWSPGIFNYNINSPAKIVFIASLNPIENFKLQNAIEDLCKHEENIKQNIKCNVQDAKYETLCLAADQFIVNRVTNDELRATVLAGFPWFMDWGRDAFIALPGLLLETGRFDEAKSVLTTFAAHAEDGMIPNRFDDRTSELHFNSVDASLWFINAAFQYVAATSDGETFYKKLLPVIIEIVNAYYEGTKFGICGDCDGLITAGNKETQLTWMDAKYNGIAFTPRYGKSVEINALWYNALCRLSSISCKTPVGLNQLAENFRKLFWNETTGYLNDCILPDGSVDSSLRPNQIFAVSLPFSPLTIEQQKAVVDTVEKTLLTPYGLRTLTATDPRYKGTCIGNQLQRDSAYHQGTVWPYLMGAFVQAYLKANKFSKKSKTKAAAFIEPLMQHLTNDGCIGSVSEIFDGDFPHKPRGCFAQAWSVAELIRAYRIITKD